MNRLAAFLVTLSRQLFWVAAFGLILAALYVSLGRQLVPLVAEYRTELQERVGTALDMPVTLGRLEGRWEGLLRRACWRMTCCWARATVRCVWIASPSCPIWPAASGHAHGG